MAENGADLEPPAKESPAHPPSVVEEVNAMSHKTLCEWRRHEIPFELKALRKIVRKPRFVCGKCARSANDRQYLCQPLRLKNKDE